MRKKKPIYHLSRFPTQVKRMTKKIFDEDVMLRKCEAQVTDCIELKDGFGIELDQTVFYPEGGGQLSDTGELLIGEKTVAVIHIREKDGHIFHETKAPVATGTKVEAQIHWQTRFDHMQQHCGEHLLSYAFCKLFGADNIGFHMSPDMVTIDLSRQVSTEEIAQAEELANEHIQADLPIRTEWMDAEKASKAASRKFNDKLTGPVRVVAIEDSDSCTCCGTHPPRTGMTGLLKIFKAEKHKQGTRIYFLCGRLALKKINDCWESLSKATQAISLKEEEICLGVSKLQEENSQLRAQLAAFEQQWAGNRAQQLLAAAELSSGAKEILTVEDDITPDAARSLAQELAKDPLVRAAVFYASKDRLNYILVQGEKATGSCRQKITAINELLQGRGGGKDNQSQGSAPLQPDWQNIVKQQFYK